VIPARGWWWNREVVTFLESLGQDWFLEPRFGCARWSAGAASSLVGAACSPASCAGELPVERRFGGADCVASGTAAQGQERLFFQAIWER
jgi:hypothetical protein